jgi:hypothetical protein
MEVGAAYSRDVQWGEMNVAFEGFPTGMDTRPLFEGLPGNRCQCPHWGMLLKGRIRILYADREEIISAGQAYYLPPGHNLVVEQDCELVELSPKGEYEKTLQAVARNSGRAGE